MKLLAILALIWVLCLVVGAAFGVLGKIIWLAVLLSIAGAIWHFIQGRNGGDGLP